MAMQKGGASIIELGIPYTDPQADGATIQHTNQVAIKGGTSELHQCLAMVKTARDDLGLTVPVVLMGYYNPFYQYGVEQLCRDTKAAGADGFIVVDLPPEEGIELNKACIKYGLSNVPLVAPTSSDKRIAALTEMASTFLYCVSVTGVTGARDSLPPDLDDFIGRVRAKTDLPLAVPAPLNQAMTVTEVGAAIAVVLVVAMHEAAFTWVTPVSGVSVRKAPLTPLVK